MASPAIRARSRASLLAWPACALAGIGLGYWLRGQELPAPAAGAPSFRAAVARCRDAVVGVHCLRPEGDDRRDGSGFVLHRAGLVLTNQHVVADALAIYVDVPGRGRFLARLVGEDPITDLAVLRLDPPPAGDLPALAFGDSDALQQGDWVLTLGHPFSFSHTVTAGLVSHVGRHLAVDSAKVTNGFLQFSAAVNPGSSGGPVLDLDGNVVGIATCKHAAGEGLAFAVPSRRVRWVLARMEEHGGRVPRGYLGVGLDPSASGGALVREVEPDGPAWRAGIRPRDRVLVFGGRPVASAVQLYDYITDATPGATLAVDVRGEDDGVARTLHVLLGAVAEAAAPARDAAGGGKSGTRP